MFIKERISRKTMGNPHLIKYLFIMIIKRFETLIPSVSDFEFSYTRFIWLHSS
ncbi:hypothetical protein PEB0149_015290 [Bartonella apis]|uniref:Uncharacterized protein n=1 Tax=Bartonella apis TaxID=1686310 RepID=A0A1R0FAS2_9HYPH|nr:hypothetical protein PEB0149_015290 [Bartonella apis]